MSDLAPQDDAIDPAAQRREARLRATQTLTRIGLKLAEALEQDLDALVDAPAIVAPGGDAAQSKREIARAFAQVGRAVALSVALEDRLDQDPETRRLEAEARAARARAEAARAEEARAEAALPRRKQQVETAVTRAIAAKAPIGSSRRYDLDRALRDALDRELMSLDRFLDGPVEQTIARVCRGLGLEPDRLRQDVDGPSEAAAVRAAALPAKPARREGGVLLKSAHPRESGDSGFFVHEPQGPWIRRGAPRTAGVPPAAPEARWKGDPTTKDTKTAKENSSG